MCSSLHSVCRQSFLLFYLLCHSLFYFVFYYFEALLDLSQQAFGYLRLTPHISLLPSFHATLQVALYYFGSCTIMCISLLFQMEIVSMNASVAYLSIFILLVSFTFYVPFQYFSSSPFNVLLISVSKRFGYIMKLILKFSSCYLIMIIYEFKYTKLIIYTQPECLCHHTLVYASQYSRHEFTGNITKHKEMSLRKLIVVIIPVWEKRHLVK